MNIEINIDGMIGPTHHFGGLGIGNIASMTSHNSVANPRAAALEGLAKMELVASMGIDQFYLPPPDRPNWLWLESLGFVGTRSDALRRCLDEAPSVLSAAYSSAFMWTANAATVAPSSDSQDGLLHFVPANLCSNLHRGQEAMERRDQLRSMFSRCEIACVHEPLPSTMALRDEGAANHMRLCGADGRRAIHVFVHGPCESHETRFTPRQSELAARRVASCLRLNENDCVFAQQTVRAINAGVFHNDVIAMSNRNMMIYHEFAFENSESIVDTIHRKFLERVGEPLDAICVQESELPLEEAVQSYLFNSQLLSVDSNEMELLCPMQCMNSQTVMSLVQTWVADALNPIRSIRCLPLDQSMKNGGGPACLRLRAMLTAAELTKLDDRYRVTAARIEKLRREVIARYPQTLILNDLVRADFAEHSAAASKAIADFSSSRECTTTVRFP